MNDFVLDSPVNEAPKEEPVTEVPIEKGKC